jgi:LuxR family maltose regulon positive regulatory protein
MLTISTAATSTGQITQRCSDFGAAGGWPLLVRTLGDGGMTVYRGESTALPRGPQLRMLKLLVGASNESVAIERIVPELWAGRSARVSRSAFDTALHRLRRYLGDESLLQLSGGALRLDRARVWTDTRALVELHGVIQREADSADLRALERLGRSLLDLYRGPFCEDETQHSIVRARVRFARFFVASVERLVARLRSLTEIACALDLVEAAIEREEMSEELHRLAIMLYLNRELPGEAARAFERCRRILRTRLRVEPAAATERLVRSVLLADGAPCAPSRTGTC